MGLGFRIFFFEEDGTITRQAATKFQRIFEAEEPYPRAAGQYLRYAVVTLLFENRQPLGINRMGYDMLHFDENGFNRMDEVRLMILDWLPEWPEPFPEKEKSNVVDFRPHLAKNEIKKRNWVPTTDELEALYARLPDFF